MMPHEFENAIYTLRTQSTSQQNPKRIQSSPTTTSRDEEQTQSWLNPPNLIPTHTNEEETQVYLEFSEAIISTPEHIYECPK